MKAPRRSIPENSSVLDLKNQLSPLDAAVRMQSMKAARKRILCIEPDRETADRVTQELTERNYAVSVPGDPEEALAQIARDTPDMVVAGMNLGSMSGLELLERVKTMRPRILPVPFLFLVAEADRQRQLDGSLGAGDYVTKPVDLDALTAAVASRLARRVRMETWPKRATLGKREVETLTWAARGKTSAEIAQILGLTKRTVDFHIDNARAKLDAATRTEAVIKAATGRLIEP
jgi:DNA-binding NarL/FixJ family response regulator